MDVSFKVRENKARRVAARRGWKLEKSRAKDPNALGYGLYYIADASGAPLHRLYLPELPYSATLEQVEEMLGITHTSR